MTTNGPGVMPGPFAFRPLLARGARRPHFALSRVSPPPAARHTPPPPYPMRLFRTLLPAAAVCILAAPPLAAQHPAGGYHSSAELMAQLKGAEGRAVQVTTVGTSAGGLPLAAVRLGAGADADARPAVLLLANAWGPQVVGSEVALRLVERLAAAYGKDTAVTNLLDRVTIYILPRVNPDAAEAFFRAPLAERIRNASTWDDDRDAAVDEDGPEDLNGDGVISTMRVRDPAGEWLADSAEPALMRKADAAKGEKGEYRVYLEGRDNDGDEQWQEDPPGGADISRNFPYEFPQFAEGTGAGMMSEPESRAVAQFIVDHPGIAVVYVFGPQDNLLKAWEGKALPTEGTIPGTSSGGPLKAILKEDEPWFTEVAARFRKITKAAGADSGPPLQGDPVSWAYFDMGRWAFGSRVWWVPGVKADSTRSDTVGAHGRAPLRDVHPSDTHGRAPARSDTDSAAADRDAIRWLRANVPGSVMDWTTIEDPDFPGREVQLGGVRPFARINPPAALLDSLTAQQTAFVTELAGMLPSITLRKLKTESLGSGLFRITVEVANDGYLPTTSALGARVQMPRRVRVALDLGKGRDLVSGKRFQLLAPIPGSGNDIELTWVVRGAAGDRMTITAESPAAGHATMTVTLR